MKRYELKLVEGGLGVFKVSVVKDPAIEQTLVHFSAEKEEVSYFTDQEKKVIYSVVMRPNMDIFRKNVNGEPANVYYTEETVEQAQINYFRQNGNKATNINHSELADAEGIFPFESWIVADPETDRASNFGLDVQKGDWVMGLKVDNDELWEEHIKTGKLDGFSVEATNINYELKEDVTMKKDEKKESGGVIAFLKEGLNKIFNDAEKFEGEIAEVSKWWQTVTNTTFEIGETVMRKAYEDDGEDYAASAGEFELEDGSRILTDSEGIIRFKFPAPPAADGDETEETEEEKMAREKAEKMADETEETEEEKAARVAAEEAAAAEKDGDEGDGDEGDGDEGDGDEELTAEEIKALQDENTDLKQQVADLKAEKVKAEADLETMTKDKKEVEQKLEKMGKETPAGKGIKNLPSPAEKMSKEDYDKMTNREKMKFNRERRKY